MGRGTTARSTLVRSDLARRWRLVVVVGVLTGLTAGIGLAAVAGARRTQTSFPRHLDATNASHVEIDPGTLDEASDAALRALPGVESASWWAVEAVHLLDDEGAVRQDTVGLLTITSDGRYLDQDRVAMVEGRRVDPTEPGEVMVNQAVAELVGLEVGDVVPIGWVPIDPGTGGPTEGVDPIDPIDAEVVGIMAPNEDVVAGELDRSAVRMYISPAYTPPEPGFSPRWYSFAWYGLRLEDGFDGTAEVLEAWDTVAGEHNAPLGPGSPEGWLTYARRVEDLATSAERAVRPLVMTLAAFGAVLLLTVLALSTQALSRSARQEVDGQRLLRQLGAERSLLMWGALAVPATTVALAASTAALTAWALSSRFPVGPFTVLEPDPGRHLDLVVAVPVLAALVVVPLVVVVATLRRELGGLLRPATGDRRASRVAAWLSRSGAPQPAVAAVRLMAPGRGDGFVPTRSVLASVVVVVTVLVAGLVFAENLRALAEDPERFGWSGDSLLMRDGGYGGFTAEETAENVATRDDVVGWRLIAGDRVAVDGEPTAGIAYGPGEGEAAGYQPVLVDGHAPGGPDEVVLGEQTLREVGKEIGDRVTLGGDAGPATIVGTAVFPTFGPVLALRTGLDVGAWVDPEARAMDYVGTDFGPPFNGLLLDLAPGAPVDTTIDQAYDVFDVVEPTEVKTVTDAVGYQPVLLAALGATGLLSVLLVLVAVVRRRRRELGIYRMLGFSPRQLRATVGFQGLLFAGAAVTLGGPLGVVLGRVLWRALADVLGVARVTDTPWALVGLAGAAVLVVAVVSTIPPALAAGRQRHARIETRG